MIAYLVIGAGLALAIFLTVRLMRNSKRREEKQSLNIDEPSVNYEPEAPVIISQPPEPTAQYVSEPPYDEIAPAAIPEPETTPIEKPNKPIRKHRKKHNR